MSTEQHNAQLILDMESHLTTNVFGTEFYNAACDANNKKLSPKEAIPLFIEAIKKLHSNLDGIAKGLAVMGECDETRQ